MLDTLKLILVIPIFPIFLIVSVLNPFKFINAHKQGKLKKLLSRSSILKMLLELVIATLVLLPLWGALYGALGISIAHGLKLIEEPIGISGTGSMYPTFSKGASKDPKEQSQELVATPGMLPYPNGLNLFPQIKTFLEKTPLNTLLKFPLFGYEIKHGDIVVFENPQVNKLTKKVTGRSTGLVKRVIGLPGDTLEIRDGLVYRNGQVLLENYTARARSTFGGEFLSDCTPLKIPEGKLFVMGDNRKGSTDSRSEVGLISYSDIDHVLPYEKQIALFSSKWRNAQNDTSESSKITLNKSAYLKLLNEQRAKQGLKLLNYQPKLENSAARRGFVILRSNDFSFEATRSGYTMREDPLLQMKQAMADAGYSNIVYGETVIPGYYEDQELFEALFEYPAQKEFLLEKDFDEIGIAEVELKVNGCNQQVIVQHLGGYIPPNYPAADIQSWKTALQQLKDIQISWKDLEKSGDFYQDHKSDIDRLNQIIATRITRMEIITKKMGANQWLSSEEQAWVKEEASLDKEQNDLATKLNNQ